MLLKERKITEQMDKPVQERVAERLETHIPQDEVARSKREPPQCQSRSGLQSPHTGLLTSPVHLPYPSTLGHSSNSFGLASPPPTSSIPSISDVYRLDVGSRTFEPQAAAKKADATGASLKSLTTSPTASRPAVSPSQSLVVHQRHPGTPNRIPTKEGAETETNRKENEQKERYRKVAEAMEQEEQRLRARKEEGQHQPPSHQTYFGSQVQNIASPVHPPHPPALGHSSHLTSLPSQFHKDVIIFLFSLCRHFSRLNRINTGRPESRGVL
jgi:hypothetical protein